MRPIYANKYPTAHQKKGSIMMLVNPVEIQCRYMYPLPLVEIEDQPEHILFCQLVWGEGRGEPEAGWIEIAKVVLNRFKAQKDYFGLNIREIITKHDGNGIYQFSAMNPVDKNYAKMKKPEEISWWKIVRAVLPVYCEMPFSMDNPATFYKVKTLPETGFWKRLKFLKEIGNHHFYRE